VKLVRLPDGVVVRGRGLRNAFSGPAPDRGLYLGGSTLRARHTFDWPHEWIDWPDFWLPRDRSLAVERIRAAHADALAGSMVEVACEGGHGRTGTVIACLAILAGVAPGEAVEWTRGNYDERAVETPWQRAWVKRFPAG
jgi:protein-tyrosine phosphatase